jgi:phage pi2 protein 07
MTNSIIPRSVFVEVHKRFGNIFDSLSPDYCFGFRCLELVDSILYFDKAVIMTYALTRSCNWSFATKVMNSDYIDAITQLGGQVVFSATPLPNLCISANAKVHEYCSTKEETRSPKFPDLDMKEYLTAMGRAVELIRNPESRLNMVRLLEAHGWSNSQGSVNNCSRKNKYSQKVRELLRHPRLKPLWSLSNKLFGMYPSGITLEFKTVEEAIDYANKYPRKRRSKADYLMEDLEMPDLKPL